MFWRTPFVAVIVLILGVNGNVMAQDPIFSQFYFAPTQLNPAFVGNSNGPSFGLNYRNQWPSVPNAYTTYAASYDQFFHRYNSGIGMILMSDNAGDGILTTNKVALQYSYRGQLNQDLFLKGGIEFAFVQNNLAWEKLVFFDQLDPEFGATTPGGTTLPTSEVPPESTTVFYPDISFGLSIYSAVFYGGVVLHHMNNPSNSFYSDANPLHSGVPIRWTLHGGAQLTSGGGNAREGAPFLSPNIIFANQGPFRQLNLGLHGGVGSIFGGLAFRHAWTIPDAVIISFGVRTGSMRIGYSFDYTVSSLGISTGGAHEIGLQYRIEREKQVNYNDCFGLFR